jgi:two-component system, NtrC family, response regulator PilR
LTVQIGVGVEEELMAKKILVIDDEGLVTTSLKQLLKKSGYEVDVANNGHAAIDKVKEDDFDLIISDIRMPDINGVEVIKKIREYLQQAGKPAVPEILITGYASKENLEEAQKLKVSDYIYKPFNIKEFLDVVKKNLESSIN